jgi:hypothetical protein
MEDLFAAANASVKRVATSAAFSTSSFTAGVLLATLLICVVRTGFVGWSGFDVRAFEFLRDGDDIDTVTPEVMDDGEPVIRGRSAANRRRGANTMRFLMRIKYPWINALIHEGRQPTTAERLIWDHDFTKMCELRFVRPGDIGPLRAYTWAVQFVPTRDDLEAAWTARSHVFLDRYDAYIEARNGRWFFIAWLRRRIRSLTQSVMATPALPVPHVGGADRPAFERVPAAERGWL